MTTPTPALQSQTPAPVSIWKKGAIGAVLLTNLAEVPIVVNSPDATSAMINILVGMPLNFCLTGPRVLSLPGAGKDWETFPGC